MSEYACEYCNNTFSKRSILYKHQHTAQYCLKLQNKGNILPCCNKGLSRKDHVVRHEKTCFKRTGLYPLPESSHIQTNVQEYQTTQLLEMIVQLQKTIANMSVGSNDTNVSNNRTMTMNIAPNL